METYFNKNQQMFRENSKENSVLLKTKKQKKKKYCINSQQQRNSKYWIREKAFPSGINVIACTNIVSFNLLSLFS